MILSFQNLCQFFLDFLLLKNTNFYYNSMDIYRLCLTRRCWIKWSFLTPCFSLPGIWLWRRYWHRSWHELRTCFPLYTKWVNYPYDDNYNTILFIYLYLLSSSFSSFVFVFVFVEKSRFESDMESDSPRVRVLRHQSRARQQSIHLSSCLLYPGT